MPPEIAKYLYDVRQACNLLVDFTQEKTIDTYLTDRLLQSAVERQFTIVGEALMQADKIDATLADHISALRQIIGFRNVLVHGYAIVNQHTVWGVLENELATLRAEVDRLLASFPPP